jgi:hypothetical protein
MKHPQITYQPQVKRKLAIIKVYVIIGITPLGTRKMMEAPGSV